MNVQEAAGGGLAWRVNLPAIVDQLAVIAGAEVGLFATEVRLQIASLRGWVAAFLPSRASDLPQTSPTSGGDVYAGRKLEGPKHAFVKSTRRAWGMGRAFWRRWVDLMLSALFTP
jgi:hypothetical protein